MYFYYFPHVFFMTTNKKQQCYPLCFFSWRPIKNDSVTPYVFFMTTNKKQQCYPLCFFHDDQRKTTVSPLMFHLVKTTVLPPMFYSIHFDSVTTCFILNILTVLPLMGFSWRQIKNDSVTLHVSFDKNNSVTLYILFDKDNSVTPYVFFHDDQ